MANNFDRRLAEHLRAAIAAAELPEPVTVERRYRPKREAKDLHPPVITVAHGLQTREPSSRIHETREHTVRIGIQARLDQTAGQVVESRCDALSDLTEALMDLLSDDLATFENATIRSIATEPFYDPAAMDNPGIWQGVLTVTYNRTARR